MAIKSFSQLIFCFFPKLKKGGRKQRTDERGVGGQQKNIQMIEKDSLPFFLSIPLCVFMGSDPD